MRLSGEYRGRSLSPAGITARACALGLGAVFASATAAQAAPLLSPHVPSLVAQHRAAPAGLPDPTQRLHLAIALPMRNQAGLDALLRALYDPASPTYRHYLSVADFTARFGATAADYDATVQYLAASGLRITGTSANRYIVDAEGSIATIDHVFHVTLRLYQHPTEQRTFIAPDREPTLDLAVSIQHVTGLDDLVRPTPRFVPATHANAATRGTGSGPHGYFLGSDMRAAYYGGTALTGTGQSLGLMELGSYRKGDVPLYFKTVKQPLNVPVRGISTDGTPVFCATCEDSEQVLDIEYAISMAPNLAQVQVYVANSPESVLNRMAADNTSKQLSTSWGWREDFATDDPLFKEMAVQGQSFLTASGDYSNLRASGPWPEEDANLIAVGGTDLTTNGPGGAWQAETAWRDSAGGPSLDRSITIAAYQKKLINESNDGSRKRRNVPDIAAAADFNFYLCADGTCSGGSAGTSFSSPIVTGYIALANQQAAAAGKPPVGFINPALYALARKKAYATDLHDITSGVSGKYSAVAGYDLVTGVGTPFGPALIAALVGK